MLTLVYFKLETKAKNVKVKNLLNPFMFSAEEAYQNSILLCAKEHTLQQQIRQNAIVSYLVAQKIEVLFTRVMKFDQMNISSLRGKMSN